VSSTLLDQRVDPIVGCLTVEAAERLVASRADPALQQRVDQLAERANRGELMVGEQGEYDCFLAAFHFVTIMQSRARRLLSAA
jgi:hypothetical protein